DAHDREVLVVALGEREVLLGALHEVAAAVQLRDRIDRALFLERLGRFAELPRRLIETRVCTGAREQLHAVERLDDEIGRAAGKRALARLIVLSAGNDDDRKIAQALYLGSANATDEGVTVELRHLDVGDDDLDPLVAREHFPTGLAVLGFDQRELARKYLRGRAPDDARIV